MQRDILLLTEMIDAAQQAQQLTADITVGQLEADRQRRDALLWNFTVFGEAAGQLSAEVKEKFPDIPWQQPIQLRNRTCNCRRDDSSSLRRESHKTPNPRCGFGVARSSP
jgi:uncharacterized protein with HEPN domain